MFPIPFNFPFIKKNGERTTIGDAINAGGGGSPYQLPTASAEIKGGVKIGSGLTMTGEVLSTTGEPGGTVDKLNMRYIVETDADFVYYAPLSKEYIGPGQRGYEIETTSTQAYGAKIKISSVVYNDDTLIDKIEITELTHDGANTYSDSNISVSYSNGSWNVEFTGSYENLSGAAYTSPLTWTYDTTVDYIMLEPATD